ncbi:MAG: 3',5'-cyclic-nucleotide phosphodiesterase [Bacteroidetes bacterium 4572_77]|nr:MAG: 3',5'-cyclic-nucleotide phosphodiesterase [Bacteroidetes bacterium 4572_77]
MIKNKISIIKSGLLSIFLSLLMTLSGQNNFELIVLGSGGGILENNLSGYLLRTNNSNSYVCLDAGTLMHGLELASQENYFQEFESLDQKESTAATVLHQHIDAYLISHPHLDHISGMLMAAPFDNHKEIICSEETANALMTHIFESPIWGNFTTEGKNPVGKWQIQRIDHHQWYPIKNNALKVKAFPLCHNCPNESSAFLLQYKNNYMLYFGDTGADAIEGQDYLASIFKEIAPLVKNKELKALFIEVSFPNKLNNKELYGHLKPQLLQNELKKLAFLVDENHIDNALYGLKIFITHIKPNFKLENTHKTIIKKELEMGPKFGATFIYPEQSDKYKF